MFRYRLSLLVSIVLMATQCRDTSSEPILSYTVDASKQPIQLFWKDKNGDILGSLQAVKNEVEQQGKTLLFAMNGGMFKSDYSPQGLYIENQQTLSPLDKNKGEGNFYLQPNGVFYISTQRQAFICTTEQFVDNGQVQYATQSGPMLLINGKIHPAFKKGSSHLNIRNGVGILPNNKVVFAMSKNELSLYDFAEYFQQLGCQNALYLDGYVSKTYLPEKNWTQTGGSFGVIIGVVADK